MSDLIFPFTAIVGQNEMKNALILNVINPSIGGVLIRGEKGTAKSTAVRALADLLPKRKASDCPFHCDVSRKNNVCPYCLEKIDSGEELELKDIKMKVVELPLSATEDMVAGTLDLEHAIKTGRKKFEPGVLAKANGNILYVDEVNLLDDHIVDLLLDSAAMGRNYIEREGVSFTHPSKFILVGTMNPEEGDLRPQLLDRFGMAVDVKSEKDVESRMDVIKRRLEFEKDPESFKESYAAQQEELMERIIAAKERMADIVLEDDALKMAVEASLYFGVDGHRADITLLKAASAHAAFYGRTSVIREDVASIANLVLTHRMRRNPFQESTIDAEELNKWIKSI
ncbi:MAG: ATP-binding protein [Candidatus Methanomethylophilaceae archaeon]|nr:ATP-binding protein [Candidatus Methanomethylophilaceae archaeon]